MCVLRCKLIIYYVNRIIVIDLIGVAWFDFMIRDITNDIAILAEELLRARAMGQ